MQIAMLEKIGVNQKLFSLISEKSLSIHQNSYLGKRIHTAHNNPKSPSFEQISLLDTAVNVAHSSERECFILKKIDGLCEEKANTGQEIQIISENAAELIAYGLLNSVFKEVAAIPVSQEKTPDFKTDTDVYIEVYCPQNSQPEQERVENFFNEAAEKETSYHGLITTIISRPITGSNKNALQYPTNKVIDKILNSKRNNDQTKKDSENILWIDLANGFEISSSKTAPYESVNHAGHTYVGSFGVWHAFYGEQNKSKLSQNRFSLKYDSGSSKIYEQRKNGIFRDRTSLSAALLLTLDGVILFENPWASISISAATKESIKKIYRFRPEYSYFGVHSQLAASEVEEILSKIKWLYY